MHDFPNEVEFLRLNKGNDMKIMGWRPPQRPEWLKQIMKTPGPIRVQLLLLLILTTSSVLSTGLQISRTVGNISGGSTSSKNESLEVEVEGLRLKVTGVNTTEAVRNLKKILSSLELEYSDERSYPFTLQPDGSITPRPNNSLSTMY